MPCTFKSANLAAVSKRLRIFGLEARGLRVGDSGGSSDPYAILTIGKSWRKQTSVRKHTLEPVWSDGDYQLSEEDVNFENFSTLNIEIKDKVPVALLRLALAYALTSLAFHPQNFIGATLLGHAQVPLDSEF